MIKKYFYKIYEKILGKFDDNDGKLLRQYYKKRFGVEVGKHSYGMDFSNIAQGTKIGAFCSIARGKYRQWSYYCSRSSGYERCFSI